MTINLIINAIPNPENMEKVQEYLSKIGPVFAQNGGEKIEQYQVIERLIGTSGIKMIGVFSFPNIENIKTMMASNEFSALSELRANAFNQLDLFICKPL